MNMFKLFCKIKLLLIFILFMFTSVLKAEIIKEINIEGNQRISSETIKMFSGVSIKSDLSENDLNKILKQLYQTNFFDFVSVKIENKILIIKVKENPIIQNINYEGIKSSEMLDDLKKDTFLKTRSSFNQVLLEKDGENIKNFLKKKGYYFSEIEILIDEIVSSSLKHNGPPDNIMPFIL